MKAFELVFFAIAVAEAVVILIIWLRYGTLSEEAQMHRDGWKRETARAGKAEERLRELEEVILVQAEAIKRRRQVTDTVRRTEQLLDPPSPAKRVQRGDCPQA